MTTYTWYSKASLDSQLGAINSQISGINAQISTNTTQVSTNTTAIATNTSAIASNTSAITTLQGGAGAFVRSVFPELYVQSGDGGDWALAITRALAYATPLGLPVQLQQLYPIATTIRLNSGDSLVGVSPKAGIQAPTNTGLVMLKATSMSNLTLDNFTVDGNCLTLGAKSYSRNIQFIGCTNVTARRLSTIHNPDWACSFEQCTNVTVTEYLHRAGAATLSGGRDGIHFLDCIDVLLDGGKIHSGDDCVGITSQTVNISRITIRNVTGVSESASVITLGNESTSAFTASDITIENISTYTSPDYAGIPNYIVKLRAQNSSLMQRVRVSNISGTSSSYGIWLEGSSTNPIQELTLTAVNVSSTGAHGIYLNRVNYIDARAIRGQSQAGSFDGIQLLNCFYGTIEGSARNCSQWGIQLNTCTSFDLVGFVARDNGGGRFSANTGGNGLITGCTDVFVNGGQFVGSATTSYYGLRTASSVSGVVVSANTRSGGAN